MADSDSNETPPDLRQEAADFRQLLGEIVKRMQEVVIKRLDSQTGHFVGGGRESLSPKELFVVDSFERLMEITKSKERLDQIRRLAGAAPLSRLELDPVEYLQLLIEVYYQELYIMSLRIERWLLYHERKLERATPFRLKCERLRVLVKEGFNNARRVRAAHVHERRHFTEDLDWAAGVSLIARTREANDPELPAWVAVAREKYRTSRGKFVAQANTDIKSIDQLLNIFAEEMLPVISFQLG